MLMSLHFFICGHVGGLMVCRGVCEMVMGNRNS